MFFRYGRLKDGTLLQGLIGSDGPFVVPLEIHLKNLADAHGITEDELDVIETDVRPDLSTGRVPLPVEKSPDDTINETRRKILTLDPAVVRAERDVAKLADYLAIVVESLTAGVASEPTRIR